MCVNGSSPRFLQGKRKISRTFRVRVRALVYLHKLERSFEIFHWVHLDAEELESHDEADGGLEDVGALLLLPELLQLWDELLPHCWEPAGKRKGKRLCFLHDFHIRKHLDNSCIIMMVGAWRSISLLPLLLPVLCSLVDALTPPLQIDYTSSALQAYI